MMKLARSLLRHGHLALLVGLLSSCANYPAPGSLDGNVPDKGPLIPNAILNIGPTTTYPLEKLVYWGGYVGVAYLLLDPFAPNWEIQEARLPENHIHFQLAMKRYYAGGAGEARVVFHRRAKELVRAGGFASYDVVEYSEGMESSLFGAQRTVEGVVRLNKAPG